MTNAQFNQLFFSLGCQMFALLSVHMHVTGSEYLRLMNSLYHQSGDFLNRLIRVHKRLRKKFFSSVTLLPYKKIAVADRI